MTARVETVDWGGLKLQVDELEIGTSEPGANDGTSLNSTELGYLDGITAGTGAASKALVPDSSGDLTFPGEITVSGSLQSSGSTSVVGNTSSVGVLSFTGGLNVVTNTNDGNDWVDLPTNVAADIGKVIRVYFSEACEVRSADSSATCNGVAIGATNELAGAAGGYMEFTCAADNTWLCKYWIANGTPTAAVPDAR